MIFLTQTSLIHFGWPKVFLHFCFGRWIQPFWKKNLKLQPLTNTWCDVLTQPPICIRSDRSLEQTWIFHRCVWMNKFIPVSSIYNGIHSPKKPEEQAARQQTCFLLISIHSIHRAGVHAFSSSPDRTIHSIVRKQCPNVSKYRFKIRCLTKHNSSIKWSNVNLSCKKAWWLNKD